MSVGSVGRTGVGALVNRFVEAITSRLQTREVDDALRNRLNDGTEPSTAILLVTLNRMFGRQFNLEGFVPGAAEFYGQNQGSMPTGRGYAQMGGQPGRPGVAATELGRAIEAAMESDPQFKEKLEAALGGQILTNGTSDGRLLVHQVPPQDGPMFSGVVGGNAQMRVQPMSVMHAASVSAGVPGVPQHMGPILQGLMQMEANIKGFCLSMNKDSPTGGTFEEAGKGITTMAGDMGGGGGGQGNLPFSRGMAAQMAGEEGSAGKGLSAQNLLGPVRSPEGLSDTAKQQMLQHMMSTLKKFYEMLSNVLKSAHDMQRTAIDNVKA
jgi:hypothetical protein